MEVYNPELLNVMCNCAPQEIHTQSKQKTEALEVSRVMNKLQKEQRTKQARRTAKRKRKFAVQQKMEQLEEEEYKQRVECEAWNNFKARNDAFFIRHAQMLHMSLPILQRCLWNDECAKREVYCKWHEEVYEPIQSQIDWAVQNKCSSTARPHIHETVKDKWNIPQYTCYENANINRNIKINNDNHDAEDKEYFYDEEHYYHCHTHKNGNQEENNYTSKVNNNECSNKENCSKTVHLYSATQNLTNYLQGMNCADTYHYGNNTWSAHKTNDNSKTTSKLTWKEQKDLLWQSFLRESNKKSRNGGSNGIFLDIIDEVSYDPLRQCANDTIYYHEPDNNNNNNNNNNRNKHCSNLSEELNYSNTKENNTISSNNGSNSRNKTLSDNFSHNSCYGGCSAASSNKARQAAITNTYNKLALAYRADENKTITGVLKHTFHVPSTRNVVPHIQRAAECDTTITTTTNNNSVHDDNDVANSIKVNNSKYTRTDNGERSGIVKRRCNRLPRPIYVANEYVALPHVSIPFDYGAYISEDNTINTDEDNDSKNDHWELQEKIPADTNMTTYDRKAAILMEDNEPHNNYTSLTHNKHIKHTENPPLMPFNNTFSKCAHYSAFAQLSLPYISTTFNERQLLRKEQEVEPMTLTSHKRDLQIRQWGERELANTRYGRFVSKEGDVLPLCSRRKQYALQASYSKVLFDHFNFPRGNKGEQCVQHTGKRMYIW